MSIQPQLPYSPGPAGVIQRIGDLSRQVGEIQQNAPASIPARSITGTQIQTGTITGGNIDAGTITASNIMAGTITATEIAAGTITAGNLDVVNVTAATVTALSVSAALISGGSIIGNILTAGTITASEISVTSLSVIKEDAGLITAGVFSTGATGNRVLMGDSISTSSGTYAGVVGIDSSSNVTFLLDASTGNVTLKGALISGSTGLGNVQGITQGAILYASGNNLLGNGAADAAGTPNVAATAATLTRDTSTYLTAPAAFKLVATGANPFLQYEDATGASAAVTVGLPYSMRAFVYSPTVNRDFEISWAWLNSGSGVITSGNGPTVTAWAGAWTRVFAENLVAPSGAVRLRMYLYSVSGISGDVFYADNAMMVQNPSAQGSMVIADSITATEISVGSLDAISANMGTLTAGTISGATITGTTISGGTITGGTFKTSSGLAPGIEIDTGNGLRAFDASGVLQFQITPAGDVSYPNSSSYTIQAIPPGYFGLGVDTLVTVQADPTTLNGNFVEASAANPSTGTKTVAIVTNGGGNSAFVQVQAGPSNHTWGNYSVWAPWSETLTSISPGATASFTVSVAFNPTAQDWTATLTFINGSWLDYCAWCVTSYNSTSISFSVTNHHTTATAGGRAIVGFNTYT